MSNVKAYEYHDTTTNITAATRKSKLNFYDTTLETFGGFKADGTTKRYVFTIDTTFNALYALQSFLMGDQGFIGLSDAKGRIQFDDETQDTLTVKDADLIIEDTLFLSGLTQYSIPFIDASGEVTEDNTNFVFKSGCLGIGTNTPDAFVEISGATEQLRLTGTTGAISFLAANAGGLIDTIGSATKILLQTAGRFLGIGYSALADVPGGEYNVQILGGVQAIRTDSGHQFRAGYNTTKGITVITDSNDDTIIKPDRGISSTQSGNLTIGAGRGLAAIAGNLHLQGGEADSGDYAAGSVKIGAANTLDARIITALKVGADSAPAEVLDVAGNGKLSGVLTASGQYSFEVNNSAVISNITGDNTVYSMVWDTIIRQTGACFATNTFTAKKAGLYHFDYHAFLSDFRTDHTTAVVGIVFSGGKTFQTRTDPTPGFTLNELRSFGQSFNFWCALNETATMFIVVYGTSKTIDIYGYTNILTTFWNGYLLP